MAYGLGGLGLAVGGLAGAATGVNLGVLSAAFYNNVVKPRIA